MEKISWEKFDGDRFQRFCNALLLFEVSKFAFVFSAKGRDGGIDQYFQGSYAGENGKWRFQDKFHNSGNKKNDIAALKRDILDDIKENYDGENFIVFLTNVSLGPAKYQELINAAESKIKQLGLKECHFKLWHVPILEGLLCHQPMVRHFYWETDPILLQTYQEYFSKQLNAASNNKRYQLVNNFYGREQDIKKLNVFLLDEHKSTAAIIANGGFGKTRLAVEYFSSEISKSDTWIPVVLAHSSFDVQGFYKLIQTKRKLLILIDDAHSIPSVVNDVKQLIENSEGKHKLILATRPALFINLIQSLPSLNREIEKLVLDKMDYADRKEMFKAELPWLDEHLIVHLAETSHGIPNLMLELIRLIRAGKNPNQITGEEAFNISVNDIISEAEKEIEKKFYLPAKKTNEFIKLISLIGPVVINDCNWDFITKFLDLRKDELENMMVQLDFLGLLDKSVISIKPDPYSDTILAQVIKTNKCFVDMIIKRNGAEAFIENIIMNLTESSIADEKSQSGVDILIKDYIRSALQPDVRFKKLIAVFELISKIVVNKPWAALLAIDVFLEIISNPTHSVHEAKPAWADKTNLERLQEAVNKIWYPLCNYTTLAKNDKEEIHQRIEKYIKTTKDFTILLSCYGFHEWDLCMYRYNPRICCERQLFFAPLICNYLNKNDDPTEIGMALEGAKILLALDFRLEEHFERATMKFTHGEAPVPYCGHLKVLRFQILGSLIRYYNFTDDHSHKERIFDLLSPYFFYMSVHGANRVKQNLDEEARVITSFFKKLLESNPTTIEKANILEKIKRFEKPGFRDDFKESMTALKSLASSHGSLYEKLELELRNFIHHDIANSEKRLTEIISAYQSFDLFAKDLLVIRTKIVKQSRFRSTLNIIGRTMPLEAKILFKEMQDNYEFLIPESFGLITCQTSDKKYFYSIIDWLWAKRDLYLNDLIWLVGVARPQQELMSEDLKYFQYAIENKIASVEAQICSSLPRYLHVDKKETLLLLDLFFKNISWHSMDLLMSALFEGEEVIAEKFPEEILGLLNSNRQQIKFQELSSNQPFAFIENHFGIEKLLSFINDKIDFALAGDSTDNFDIYNPIVFVNPKLDHDKTEARFINVVNLFLDDKNQDVKKRDFVFNFFRPAIMLSSSLFNLIKELVGKHRSDNEKLFTIASAMQGFARSKQLIELMCFIAASQSEEKKNFQSLTDLFGRNFYSNDLGTKSRVGLGIPYNEDAIRKQILEEIISEGKYDIQVTGFLQKCLEKVRETIEQTLQEDKAHFV